MKIIKNKNITGASNDEITRSDPTQKKYFLSKLRRKVQSQLFPLSQRGLLEKRQSAADTHGNDQFLTKDKQYQEEFIQVCLPDANKVYIEHPNFKLTRQRKKGWFTLRKIRMRDLPKHYRLYWEDENGTLHNELDPYTFQPQINEFDLKMFNEGRHPRPYHWMGANHLEVDGIKGVLFAAWAPNADRVSVIGDFNHWNGLRHPMRKRGLSGIWELFIPELEDGFCYKFEIRHKYSGKIYQKIDAYGRQFEVRPKTASLIAPASTFSWNDAQWLASRYKRHNNNAPISIYELHTGSWKRNTDGSYLNFRQLALKLVPYVKKLGFTHIELLPQMEHPFDGSWGYQALGYYAVTSRFGSADDFRFFVDHCHQHQIGVILDWVASHFPKDPHGLIQYDGQPLYEYADPKKAEHPDWGSLVFDYGRNEVKNFLIGNALFWLDEFHLDGLRVDAVASMLYLDYSRLEGEWSPNVNGGNENLEAMVFLQTLNEQIKQNFPDTLTFAEESSLWPLVTFPENLGGLGFSMKWNMGWMHDTLAYFEHLPEHRSNHQELLNHSLSYAFKEQYCLALSHDEVVHEKHSLLGKMPGDGWQQHANLRLLYSFMFSYPGKKLMFMGGELGQQKEWQHDAELDWYLLDKPEKQGIQNTVCDLNSIYQTYPAMHSKDFDPTGFKWINGDERNQTIMIYSRHSDHQHIVIILNMTPSPYYNYSVGVPGNSDYKEIFNSDASRYGGSNVGNLGHVACEPIPYMGFDNSISVTLPPLAAIFLIPN